MNNYVIWNLDGKIIGKRQTTEIKNPETKQQELKDI